jgi:hypothetical protein
VKFDPAHGELDRIRAAMDHIRAGAPELSIGALTVVALAAEVGVPGNALSQRHTEPEAEFYQRIRGRARSTRTRPGSALSSPGSGGRSPARPGNWPSFLVRHFVAL